MMGSLFETVTKGATFSPCGKYRYRLWRIWDDTLPLLLANMLNPSDADAEYDDPTLKKVTKFGRSWGFGGAILTNFYAWSSPDPDDLLRVPFPVAPSYDPEANDRHIAAAAEEVKAGGGVCLAAWGAHKAARARAPRVKELLAASGIRVVCLRTTKDGHPWHPLYVPDAQRPTEFSV